MIDWQQKLADAGAELKLAWLDDSEQAAVRERWLATWAEIPAHEEFHEACTERLQRCVPLATGPSRARRLRMTQSTLTLVADPLDPDFVFLSYSAPMPSMLWARSQPTSDAVLAATAPYLVAETPSVVDLPQVHRFASPLGVDDRSIIENFIEFAEPWLDDATWCSAFDDDPWRDVDGPLNMVQQSIWLRDTAEEISSRFPSITWRTLWSRSTLKLEQHWTGLWVFELRYAPANDSHVVAMVNELTGGHLPADVPVDLAASVTRGEHLDHVALGDMRSRGDDVRSQMMLMCALEPAETTTDSELRRVARTHADNPEVLDTVVSMAIDYLHHGLLFDLAREHRGTKVEADILDFFRVEGQP